MSDDGSSNTPGNGVFTLLGDQPHVDGDDPLGFDGIVEDLTRLVLASRHSTPFTLGIDAGWGMGKSSLMRKLEHNLGQRSDVETVWSNAWTAEGHSVLEGLIKSVLDKIDPNILRRTLRRKNLMSGVRVAISILAGLLRLGNVVDKIWERISLDPRARNQMRDLMAQAMDEWMKRGRAPEHRLLAVFIDDLDRCSPSNVFQVFEALKLYLDTQGFVFVIGFDSTVISEAIRRRRSTASRSPAATTWRRSSRSDTGCQWPMTSRCGSSCVGVSSRPTPLSSSTTRCSRCSRQEQSQPAPHQEIHQHVRARLRPGPRLD